METSAMLSPLRRGAHYEALRRYPNPPEPAELVYVAPPLEPNFRIDDLLDFSNSELCDEEVFVEGGEEGSKEGNSTSGNDSVEPKDERSGSKVEGVCEKAGTSGLCVPSDELADQLEWLSTFNEDSSYSGDRQLASLVSSGCLGGPKDDEKAALLHESKFQSPSPISVLEPTGTLTYPYTLSTSSSSSQHIPSRARSKRVRAGARIWSLDSLIPTLFDTRAGGAVAQESPVFFGLPSSSDRLEPFVPSKKAKKPAILYKPVVETPPRRCSHCLVQKTPQWRAGPMGPKTLCNACGVRYKSGRLVPEYRPAGSPTFVSEVHSNSHKRILEMRRVKEVEEEHMEAAKERPEEEDSDCLSQTESCKEEGRIEPSARRCCSQEDLNGSICSEKDDGMGFTCSGKEDPAGSICIEKAASMGLVCSSQSDAASLNRAPQMALLV